VREPRLLLLSPVFHGYWSSIAEGFRQIGLDVAAYPYDAKGTFRQKLAHKIFHEFPVKAGAGARVPGGQSAAAADVIRGVRPDITIIIRGDDLGDEVYDALTVTGSRSYLWLWDEVRRTGHDRRSLARFEHLLSYSPLDTAAFQDAGLACLHVPNAFDPAMTAAPRQTDDVVFIGARYPRREHLLKYLSRSGVPVRAYGRDWSRHPIDLARTWQVTRPPVPAARDIDRLDGYALTAGAPAAINIHGDQDGFTMKTFEVPGVGGVQLIDRDDVSEYYDPGTEVAVFHSEDELVELCERAIRDDGWGDAMRAAGRKRTLAEHTWAHRAARVAELWA